MSQSYENFSLARYILSSLPIRTEAEKEACEIATLAFITLLERILDEKPTDDAKTCLQVALATIKRVVGASKNRGVPHSFDKFRDPPKESQEEEVLAALLEELSLILTKRDLINWWKTNRKRIDLVVSFNLRNVLMDTIRTASQKLE